MHPDSGKLRVIRHNPKRDQLIRFFLLIFIALLGGFAYWYGGNHAGQTLEQVRQQNISLESKASVLQEENNELRQRLAILESASKMDRAAVNNVRLLVRKLEEEKEQLHKELTFFKSILAPEDMSTGVRVADFSLLEGDESGQYRLRLVISQVARSNPFLKGTLSVSLIGEKDGKVQTLPLQQLVESDQITTRLGFRYFQALPSDREYLDISIPEGFQPAEVKVVVQITSGIRQSFEQIYLWDKELLADVRQEQNSG
ncbi:DUF6776 family protein [Endozoicomonas sp. SCSIO W0465]|uniref:DUF6776 family protein n=1 Tax=Endozoicomonas sp. SCSIO W0465 TaxID=2918516 RepID=UPI0020763820|nr:DUF6776 family protein [Endozoicomonas sp. SCSIO W0465]USE38465.1 hypothetical protein MJO57_10030 [Endozoicomonas sp. SCSIO W0465]